MSASPRSRRPRRSLRPRRARPPRSGAATARSTVDSGPLTTLETGRAALAGLEGVLLAWLLVVLPALVVYMLSATAPVLGDASWQESVRVATGAYLLGSGGELRASMGGEPALLSLAPLGMTLLTGLAVGLAARRVQVRRAATGAVTVATVVLAHLALSLLARGSTGRLNLALGSALVAALAIAVAQPTLLRRDTWPWWLREGVTGAGVAAGGLALIALGAAVAAAVLGRDEIAQLTDAVAQSGAGAVLLGVAQAVLVPNLLVWALSFAAGPGFVVGEGTSFTSTHVVSGPLPAVPLLGALPHPGSPAYGWLVVVVVAVGVVVGLWWVRRRRDPGRTLAGVGVTVAATAVGGALAGHAASGSIGPLRMAQVGVAPWELGGALAVEVGAPALALVGLALALDRHRARSRAGEGRAGGDEDGTARDDR